MTTTGGARRRSTWRPVGPAHAAAPAAVRGIRRRHGLWLALATLVIALLVAMVGTGGTYALWNGTATTGSGTTIKSGTATIAVGSLSAMNTSVLAPGTGVVGTFSVKNTGTIPLGMRVATTATKVSYATNATDAQVLDELQLTLSVVGSAAACRTGLGGASARLATFDTGSGYYTLPVGASGIGCLEIDLDTDAPQTVTGAVANFTLTVTGTQVTS